MDRVVGSALRTAVACNPSMPGNWMSMRIRSGWSDRARVRPDSASVALSTVCPADLSRKVARVMLAGLSYTTSTFPTLRYRYRVEDRVAASHGAPDFNDKSIAVDVGLFHDRHHIAIELVSVFSCDLLGRHY